MHRLFLRVGTLAIALPLVFLASNVVPSVAAEAEQNCSYIAAYGTVLVLPGGTEVPISADTAPSVVGHALTCAEQNLSGAEAQRYQEQSGALVSHVNDPMWQAESSLLRLELAGAISTNEIVQEQTRIGRRLLARLGDVDVESIAERHEALEVLRANGWTPPSASRSHRESAAQYLANCRLNGVPVPGPIATDTKWSAEDLTADAGKYFFLPEKKALKAWTYRDSGGFCVALARQSVGENELPPLIGTICTDQAQKHACFFDNQIYGANGLPERLSEAATLQTDYSELVHPLDAGDGCNQCHVGDNPFIVHPSTKLGTLVQGLSGVWSTKPLDFAFVDFGTGLKTWLNPPPISVGGTGAGKDGACMRCHDIPAAYNRYCSGILELAARRTMPPEAEGPHEGLWPDEDGCFPDSVAGLSAYFPSLRKLKSVCWGWQQKDCSAP